MKQVVIDASVVLRWYLSDEEYGPYALKLLDRYVTGELTLLAPSLLEYEVANGLIIAWRRGRIEEGRLLLAMEGFFDLGIKLKGISHLYPKLLYYCKVYNCSAYDASYLALAEQEEISLITADKKVFSATAEDLPWVKWLGDMG
ncbi:MAG: hypothetical protein DRG50_05375 [Deltaproteobacteria bacterium]|nr:MAG: hypothetical protein DRG50_05375 [Deltaproteobacteria bacterium]